MVNVRKLMRFVRRVRYRLEGYLMNIACSLLGLVVKLGFRKFPCVNCMYAEKYIDVLSYIGRVKIIECSIFGIVTPPKYCMYHKKVNKSLCTLFLTHEFIDTEDDEFIKILRKAVKPEKPITDILNIE